MLSGMAGMVAQGMALGTGSALAHRAVDSMFSSGSNPEPAQAQAAAQQMVREDQPCSAQAKLFSDCMSFQHGDMMACQQYFDAMQQCRVQLHQ